MQSPTNTCVQGLNNELEYFRIVSFCSVSKWVSLRTVSIHVKPTVYIDNTTDFSI